MIFHRHRSGPSGKDRAPEAESGEAQSCPSLKKALGRTFRLDRPSILDLGPMSGPTVTELAARGARVTVEAFEPPPPRAGDDEDADEAMEPEALRLDHPDEAFHLVLAWEHVDFVPPDRLDEFFAELRRVLAVDGWLLMFSMAKPQRGTHRLPRYRIIDEDRVLRERSDDDGRRRWAHPTRTIERAMRGFSVQGIHLQRTQLREILATKRQTGKPRSRPIQSARRPATHAKPVRR